MAQPGTAPRAAGACRSASDRQVIVAGSPEDTVWRTIAASLRRPTTAPVGHLLNQGVSALDLCRCKQGVADPGQRSARVLTR
jgi:hypothetical protein